MKKTGHILTLLFAAVFSAQAIAYHSDQESISFGSPIKVTLSSPSYLVANRGYAALRSDPTSAHATHEVYLMNIHFSPTAKSNLMAFQSLNNALSDSPTLSSIPVSIQRGMNGIPVLDQGQHGTCATFANTAAIDALLKRGDYISQLSLLNLGSHLEKSSFIPDGWDGSLGPYVLNRLVDFGIVKKSDLHEYPLDEDYSPTPITLDQYSKVSEGLVGYINWYSILTIEDRIHWNKNDIPRESLALLAAVKTALANNDRDVRVTFGILLPAIKAQDCSAGACAKFHVIGDTWAITKAIRENKDLKLGGHEMVITGYDDNAVAIDNEGKRHTGLLFLRNSWSSQAGDHGDFYMTYEFFRSLVIEVQVIERFD